MESECKKGRIPAVYDPFHNAASAPEDRQEGMKHFFRDPDPR